MRDDQPKAKVDPGRAAAQAARLAVVDEELPWTSEMMTELRDLSTQHDLRNAAKLIASRSVLSGRELRTALSPGGRIYLPLGEILKRLEGMELIHASGSGDEATIEWVA